MPLSVLPGRLRPAPAARGLPDEGGPAGSRAKRPRLHVLDGMRLMAALAVMSFHFIGKPVGYDDTWRETPAQALPTLHRMALYGWTGVELFFLISGFVICMSCWGKRSQDFFVSRVVRLYPAYWISVLLTSAVVLTFRYDFSTVKDITPRTVIVNLTMLQTPVGAPLVDPSYWTLWTELVFYVVFGAVMAGGPTYRRVVAFCGGWTFAAAIAPSVNLPLLTTLTLPDYAPFFTAGITMYLMYRFGPNLLLWGMLGLSWMIALWRLEGTVQMYQMYLPAHSISWSVAATLVTLCFLLVLAAALGLLNRIRWRRLTVAGALTYPLYLLHQEIGTTGIHLLRRWLAPLPTLVVVVVGLLLLAWLVHRLVERPLSGAMKKRLDLAFATLSTADAQAGTQAGVRASTQTGVQAGAQSGVQAGAQSGAQAGAERASAAASPEQAEGGLR
ncbi:acyltransferase [Kitasatospora sp. NBC_01287]|uniref:acyltransferase family protein n=1 Tax=Kitasatospora sp. NBC_01287 TaxID=2903573 RepID=UPI00224F4A66|nr:acyltransferase [Kitasatospora sp. NBC_01287]MCX4748556.1 acyltransferase [Kitasatospora sp. NBC_01287]